MQMSLNIRIDMDCFKNGNICLDPHDRGKSLKFNIALNIFIFVYIYIFFNFQLWNTKLFLLNAEDIFTCLIFIIGNIQILDFWNMKKRFCLTSEKKINV